MKTTLFTLVTVSLLCLSSFKADAREKGKNRGATPTPTTTSSYREPAEGSGGDTRFGFGFATYGGVSNGHSLSALLHFSAKSSLQITAAIGSTSPFTVGGGGVYRMNFYGTHDLGFHGGLGLNLGSAPAAGAAAGATSSFFLDVFPLAGFQFGLGGAASNVYLSFDGGAVFHATPSPFQFSLQPISAIAGAAIHYMF